MDQQFQLSLLCYLVQSPNGKSYIESINDDTFDLVEFKLTSQVLKRYYKFQNQIPGRLQATAFLEEEIANTRDMPEPLAKDLREVFEDIYIPLDPRDVQYIEDQLINSLQEKQIEVLGSRFAKGELGSKEFIQQLAPIAALALPGEEDIFKESGFLVADRDKHSDERIEGTPTFLHDLDKLTAARGFYSPQLIVFMSGPKHFKTGVLLSLALGFMRDGLNVYYADIENGARSIRNRLKMAILDCELHELFDGAISKETVDGMLELNKFYMGGDMFIDNYPAYSKSITDVENRLALLKKRHGFVPDVIFWDPLDKFIPSSKEDLKRDNRIQSQRVYHEAVNLNKKLECFSFTPSQANRAAISKKTLSMTDIAEDFGRVMIAHAVFAICATDSELEQGIRRIIPVAQREGVGYLGKYKCIIKIDESRMQVEEAEDETDLTRLDDD